MRDLQELVSVVNRYKTRKIEIIGNVAKSGKTENIYQEFYKLLCAGKFSSDEEAANYFGYKNPSDKGFRRLKSGLQKRIVNSAMFIDQDSQFDSERHKIYFRCSKIWVAARAISSKTAFNVAYNLAESIVKDLVKIEAIDLLYLVLDYIKLKSAFIKGDQKKFEYYNELSNQCLKQLQEEHIAKTNYSKMMIKLVKSKKYDQELVDEIRGYFEELKQIKNPKSTCMFLANYYIIGIASEMTAQNHVKAIEICDEAIKEYGKNEFHVKSTLAAFYHQKAACLISVDKLEDAEKEIQECTNLLTAGSFNWYKDRELSICLFFHQKKFQQGFEVFLEARYHPNFNSLNAINIEQWKLTEAWMHFFIKHELIQLNKDQEEILKKFRINKFLNDVPLYSKDKSGMNIHLIILQILFALQDKKYGLITDRIDALKKYQSRYLKKDDNYRSNIIIRMLISMGEASFHKSATIRKTNKLWEQLQNVPSNLVDTNIHVEKVPYEMIWNAVLEYLDDRMH